MKRNEYSHGATMLSKEYEDLSFQLRDQLPDTGGGWKDEWAAARGFALTFFDLSEGTPLLEVPIASQVVPRACQKGSLADQFNTLFFSSVVIPQEWLKCGTLRSMEPSPPWKPTRYRGGPASSGQGEASTSSALSSWVQDAGTSQTFSLTQRYEERKIELRKLLGDGGYGAVVQADLELPVGHPLLDLQAGAEGPSSVLRLVGFHNPDKGHTGWLRFRLPANGQEPQEDHLLLPAAIKFEGLSGWPQDLQQMMEINPSATNEAIFLCALQQMLLRRESPGFPLFYGSMWLQRAPAPVLEQLPVERRSKVAGPVQATVLERTAGSAEQILPDLLRETSNPLPPWFLVGSTLMQVVFAYSTAHHQFWLQHDDLRLGNLLVRDVSSKGETTLDVGYSSSDRQERCQAVTDLYVGHGLGEIVLADFGAAAGRLAPNAYRALTPFKLRGSFLPHPNRSHETYMELGPQKGVLFKIFDYPDETMRRSRSAFYLDKIVELLNHERMHKDAWNILGMDQEKLISLWSLLLFGGSKTEEDFYRRREMIFTQRTSLLHLIVDLVFIVGASYLRLNNPSEDNPVLPAWRLLVEPFPEARVLSDMRALVPEVTDGTNEEKTHQEQKLKQIISYILPAFFPEFRIGGFLESDKYQQFVQELKHLQEAEGYQLFRYHQEWTPEQLREEFDGLTQSGKRAFLYEEK